MAVSGIAAACAQLERFGLVADDALIHQMQFGVGALAGHVAGVEHGVAGF